MSFENLNEQARMLGDSYRLGAVTNGLEFLMDGKPVDKKMLKNFLWAGELVKHMDQSTRSLYCPELVEIATRLKPSYYKFLSELGLEYELDFCNKLCEYLKSPEGKIKLSRLELTRAVQLFRKMGDQLLGEFNSRHSMGRI